jgi:paraquat-inducible protein A
VGVPDRRGDLVPANVLPVMTTVTASGRESDTILQGVVLLWSPTGWPLSLIVLFASVMIPSAKIAALVYLVVTVRRGSVQNNAQRIRLYRIVETIGRWSMVDVFVDTFTVALIQLQPLMSVEPGPGLPFFAAVVVLTMLAVESFDPRLIWDSSNSREVPCLTTTHVASGAELAGRAEEPDPTLVGLDRPDRGDSRRRLGRRRPLQARAPRSRSCSNRPRDSKRARPRSTTTASTWAPSRPSGCRTITSA